MGRESGDGVNFSPRSPLGMGILDMADVLPGLGSRSMPRGTFGPLVGFVSGDLAPGGRGDGVVVVVVVLVVEAWRIAVCQRGWWWMH